MFPIQLPLYLLCIASLTGMLLRAVRMLTKFHGLGWTRAVAIAHLEHLDVDQIVFQTEFEYVVDNQYYRMIDHVTFGLTHYRLGREVWMRFDPADPRRAYVWRTWPGIVNVLIPLAGLAGVLWAMHQPWPVL